MSNDTINGGSGNDTIFAGIGNDLVTGGAGDDIIFDGAGNDTVSGGADDDSFWLASGSNDGSDDIDGGSGNDTLIEDLTAETPQSISIFFNLGSGTHYTVETPGVGVDTLAGIENFRLIGDFDLHGIGSSAANSIQSDAGDDSLSGLQGDDVLESGDGNDTLIGGSGADSLIAGSGDDLIFVDNVFDYVDGGDGEDRVIFNVTSALDITLTSWVDVERVDGNSGSDTINGAGYNIGLSLNGGAGQDSLTGGNQEDLIQGGDDNDTLIGGAKRDFLFGGGGADYFEGGQGNDFFYVDNSGDEVHGGIDFDRVTLDDVGVDVDMASWTSVERVIGGSGNDRVDASTTTSGMGLQGNGGDDTLIGGSGNDVFFGNAGNDSLVGNDGVDILVGDAGADTMSGGEGDDTFFISEDGDVAHGGNGLDRARVNGTVTSIDLTMTGWTSVERFNGSTGNDTIDASPVSNGMSINGNLGDDLVIGGSGSDLLFGNSGDDTLRGGDDADFMWGDAGNDVYEGGAGDDFFYLLDAGDRVADGGSGYDRVTLIKAGLSITIDGTWAGVERVDGAAGSEVIDASGYSEGLFMVAAAGNDTFTGSTADDYIFGNDGNDVLDGGLGGNDVMLGGAGADRFVFADGAGTERINDWEDGIDLMDVSAISGVSGMGDLGITITSSTTISAGAETIILTGFVGTLDASDFDFGM